MICDFDDVKEINVIMYVVMVIFGEECMKFVVLQINIEMFEVIFFLLIVFYDCYSELECIIRWLDCVLDMNVIVVCKYVIVNIKRCDRRVQLFI